MMNLCADFEILMSKVIDNSVNTASDLTNYEIEPYTTHRDRWRFREKSAIG